MSLRPSSSARQARRTIGSTQPTRPMRRPRCAMGAHNSHRARDPRLAARIALGLALILLAAAPLALAARTGATPVAGHDAQSQARTAAQRAIGYTLVDEWRSVRPTGAYTLLPWEEGHRPGGVGISALSDRFVATDRSAHTVRVYGDDDRLLATLGGPGDGPGRLMDPRDAAILRDGRIAVSDTGNDRVVVLDALGGVQASWPVEDPRGIAVETINVGLPGEQTLVLVLSAGARKLLLFSPEGEERGQVGLGGAKAPDALVDVELRLGPGGEPQVSAAVIDAADGRLLLFAPSESAFLILSRPGLRAALALRPPDAPPGASGTPAWWLGVSSEGLFLRDAAGKAFPPTSHLSFDAVHDLGRPRRNSGRVLAAVEPLGLVSLGDDPAALAARLAANPAGRLFGPSRIAAGADVLVADRLPRIAIYDREGDLIDTPIVPSLPLSGETPRAIDVAAEGDLRFALAADGRLLAESRNGFGRFRAAPTDRPSLRFAIDAHGGLLLVLDLLSGRIERLDPQLDVVDDWALESLDGSRLPADLSRAGETTYLAAPGSGVLETRTSTGRLIDRLPVAGIPERVAALPGAAFVLTAAGWVHRYDIGGNLIAAWPVAEGEQRPVDLAVDEEARVYVVDERGAVRVYAPQSEGDSPTLPRQALEGTCTIAPDKRAAPSDIELGETVTVTLSLAGSCAVPAAAVDVVLAVDRSASMAEEGKLAAALEATAAFAVHLDPATARIGVVDFGDIARQVVALDADAKPAITAVARLSAGGDTDLVGGLREATAMLLAEGRADAVGHIVLLTDGRHTAAGTPADEVDEAAFVARAAGLTLHAVALGEDADLVALAEIAGAPERLHRSPGPFELAGIYARIARGLGSTELFASLVVTDRLPANMTLVPNSAAPPAALIEDGRTLEWRLSGVAGPLQRLRYRLRPQEAGIHPTNREALAGGKDPLGVRHDLVFPIPTVRVFRNGGLPTSITPPTTPTMPPSATPAPSPSPSPVPSATRTPTVDISPSPTPSLTPSPTASPTTPVDDPTAPPSATATRQTPTTRRIYLPLASNVRCPTGRKPVDVVLVLDTSLSMDTVDAPGGPTRRAAATKAAGEFIDLLDLGRDRAGIVGFNDRANLAAALTGDRNLLRGALATLPAAPGTRIDRGLDAAASALLPVAPGRVPLVVLLTDGAADSAATADALVAAQRLHRAGVTVFVIGLGADVDSTLLLLVASRPGLYLAAPDPRELGAAFRAVAARIPCG